MPKNNKKSRKTRSDKFPLTLHSTGQFCKKIKGKIYYFGKDRRKALESYFEQAAYLHSGKSISSTNKTKISIKDLANQYLDHLQSRVSAGEIRQRQLYDQTRLLRHFVKSVGPKYLICDVATIDIQNYKKKLIKENKSANTINNYISAVKAMFHWASENEIIAKIPNLAAVKKLTDKVQDIVNPIKAQDIVDSGIFWFKYSGH
jgi:hypothetical protein